MLKTYYSIVLCSLHIFLLKRYLMGFGFAETAGNSCYSIILCSLHMLLLKRYLIVCKKKCFT